MKSAIIVRIQDLVKTYSEGGRRRRVLDCVNVDIFQGEFLVMLGKSGSGKSTLLNMLSGIDTPDDGKVLIDGIDITAMSDTGQTLFRRDNIGIIFQFFNLIPTSDCPGKHHAATGASWRSPRGDLISRPRFA